ncbi:MAG TPA: hypothetical protein PLD36_07365 [Bacteroidia bacterium]|nr:hypothetical protein [Bacteroidia bacterium]
MRTLIKPYLKVHLMALAFVLVSVGNASAVTYYSRTNNGMWKNPTTWSTVTYGNTTNTGTYPQRGDIVFIGNAYTINVDTNVVVTNLTIGQGVSGKLFFPSNTIRSITVNGNLTINKGAQFAYAGNNTKTHSLFISGNLINNGLLDLYSDANDLVNLTFNGKVNSTVSGTGTFDLNTVTLFKNTLTTYELNVQVSSFETAVRTLVLTYGTYVHNNTGNFQVNPFGGNFTIPVDASVTVPVGILALSPRNQYLYLEGKINVTGGTVTVGSTAGNGGIRYYKNGTSIAAINISSGQLSVYGGITNRIGYATDPFVLNITGGSILCNSGTTGTTDPLLHMNNNASSAFRMSGGNIVFQKPNRTGSTVADFDLNGTAGAVAVTDGTVQFGNASTSAGAKFNFVPYSGVVQPNFKVSGPAASTVSLYTSNSSTSDFSLLSLNIESSKVFDINSISGTAGSSKVMTLTHNFDGIHGFYNNGTFNARNSTVLMQAPEGQWIGGSVTTTFYKLSINNPFGVSIGAPINISNSLTLFNGIVYTTSTNIITCLANSSASIGSSIAYIDGPLAQVVASSTAKTLNIPLGKNGVYRPMILAIRHTNSTSVTYVSEVMASSARSMSYTLPSTLSWVSDVRYYNINRTAVANLATARLTLTYGTDDVVTNYSNLRIARDNGTTAWIDLGGSGTANGSGNITSTTFSGFNRYFTLANSSSGSNPLPVEFVAFNAIGKRGNALLDWSTASEKDADYFEVQKSKDGKNFYSIGKVLAHGNSTVMNYYNFVDANIGNGVFYYRIKEIDYNGEYLLTGIKVVKQSQVGVVALYPNPVSNGTFSVVMPEDRVGVCHVVLYDNSGRLVYEELTSDYNSKFTVSSEQLFPGSYSVKITDSAGNEWQNRIVVM